MNVQLSLSASSFNVGQSRNEEKPVTEPITTTVNSVSSIRDIKDVNTIESQGGSVSVADKQLIQTIERAVKSLQGPQTTLDISIHEKTHQIMVKVMNKDTGELIREIPSEKTLDLVAKMMEIAGILIDERI